MPSNTPVYFTLTGANAQTLVAHTDAAGAASVAYTGVYAGADKARANATIGVTTYQSNPAQIAWASGKHATQVTLNQSPTSLTAGKAATLKATLTDISPVTATPIAGASLQFTVGALNCNGTTDANGQATCSLMPGAAGLATLVVTYAGNATYQPASAHAAARDPGAGGVGGAIAARGGLRQPDGGHVERRASRVLANAGNASFTLSTLALGGANPGDFALGAGAGHAPLAATSPPTARRMHALSHVHAVRHRRALGHGDRDRHEHRQCRGDSAHRQRAERGPGVLQRRAAHGRQRHRLRQRHARHVPVEQRRIRERGQRGHAAAGGGRVAVRAVPVHRRRLRAVDHAVGDLPVGSGFSRPSLKAAPPGMIFLTTVSPSGASYRFRHGNAGGLRSGLYGRPAIVIHAENPFWGFACSGPAGLPGAFASTARWGKTPAMAAHVTNDIWTIEDLYDKAMGVRDENSK